MDWSTEYTNAVSWYMRTTIDINHSILWPIHHNHAISKSMHILGIWRKVSEFSMACDKHPWKVRQTNSFAQHLKQCLHFRKAWRSNNFRNFRRKYAGYSYVKMVADLSLVLWETIYIHIYPPSSDFTDIDHTNWQSLTILPLPSIALLVLARTSTRFMQLQLMLQIIYLFVESFRYST